ncbi:MAG: hypothetical protein IPM39_13445 [Chloroflexi bacterium]|nr:hypothetical protein [Chloroflexota bacterium]
MTTDLTFITNENKQSLKDRFNVLIKDARFFAARSGQFFVRVPDEQLIFYWGEWGRETAVFCYTHKE